MVTMLPKQNDVGTMRQYCLAHEEDSDALAQMQVLEDQKAMQDRVRRGSINADAIMKQLAASADKKKKFDGQQIKLSVLFGELEAKRIQRTPDVPIQEWSVGKTTLDEVFLRIVEKHQGVNGPKKQALEPVPPPQANKEKASSSKDKQEKLPESDEDGEVAEV
jgi:hypothetical protein